MAVGKMYLLRKRKLTFFPFLPLGAPGVYRYDGLYFCTKRRFELAPWHMDAETRKSKGLKAFYFDMRRATAAEDPEQIAAPWSAEGQRRERCTVALLECVVRLRVRAIAPVDLLARACGVPCPSADEDKWFAHYCRMTGGQTDEAFGVWWSGDLAAARAYALAKAAGRTDVEEPQMPEDVELLRLMRADAANRRAWDTLRSRGVARRAGTRAVNSAAANMVLEEFQCERAPALRSLSAPCALTPFLLHRSLFCPGVIMGTGDVSDETVTTPCGHNFDRASLQHYLRDRIEAGHAPTCVSCGDALLPAAEWSGGLAGKVNSALVAAVKAITGAL